MQKPYKEKKKNKLTGLIGEPQAPQAAKNYQLGKSRDLQHKPPNTVKTLHRHKDLPKLDSSHSSIYSLSLNDCPLQTG